MKEREALGGHAGRPTIKRWLAAACAVTVMAAMAPSSAWADVPTLQMDVSPSTVTIPGGVAVTATASEDFIGSGYGIAILDDDDDTLLRFCSYQQIAPGRSCNTTAYSSWNDNDDPQPMNFRAELRVGVDTPAGDPVFGSAQVQAHEIDIEMSADASSVEPNQSTWLRATSSESLTDTPFEIRIINEGNEDVVQYCHQAQLGANRTVCEFLHHVGWDKNLDTSDLNFRAELVRADTHAVVAADSATISIDPIRFDVSLTLPTWYPSSWKWAAEVTASPAPNSSPYSMVIRSEDGAFQYSCALRWGWCTTDLWPGTYRATVEDAEGNVFGGSQFVTGNGDGTTTTDTVGGFSLAGVAALYPTAGAMCAELTWAGGTIGSHTNGSTESDQGAACNAVAAAGGSPLSALEAMIAVGTGLATGGVLAYLAHRGAEEHAPPGYLTPDDLTAPPSVAEPTWPVADVADALAARTTTFTEAQVQEIARQCLYQAAAAGLFAASECESQPIFVTGSTTPESTWHDLEALATRPSWTRLHYRSSGYSSQWYLSETTNCGPGLTGAGTTKACDEFPMGSTAEGGPGKGVSLKAIDSDDNSLQGSFLSGLYACPIVPIEYGPYDQAAFLVVAVPPSLGVPTRRICL